MRFCHSIYTFEVEIIEFNYPKKEFRIKYKNFPQYQASAWMIKNTVLTIVYPVKFEIDVNYEDVKI